MSSTSSSFRQNSYSYNTNINDQTHRSYPNMQTNSIAGGSGSGGPPGVEYYENNSNLSSSSSNDYYSNYRNYGPPGKDSDKYWNESRSKARNISNLNLNKTLFR